MVTPLQGGERDAGIAVQFVQTVPRIKKFLHLLLQIRTSYIKAKTQHKILQVLKEVTPWALFSESSLVFREEFSWLGHRQGTWILDQDLSDSERTFLQHQNTVESTLKKQVKMICNVSREATNTKRVVNPLTGIRSLQVVYLFLKKRVPLERNKGNPVLEASRYYQKVKH